MREHIVVHYNSPGHPREFTIHLPGYDMREYIPVSLERRFARGLPESWHVSNRGSRLEVNSADFTGDGDPHIATIEAALTAAVVAHYGHQIPVEVELSPYRRPESVGLQCPHCPETLQVSEAMAHIRAHRAVTA